jgi:CheY-like chemotaxis protein
MTQNENWLTSLRQMEFCPTKMHFSGNYSDQQPLILLIDEEPEALQELAPILSAAGYLTQCCLSAEQALAAAKIASPDLIISNVVVHEQGGMEICEQIKSETGQTELVVMFLSSNQIPDIIRRRGPLGGSYYLRKPFDSEILLDLLEKSLNSLNRRVLLLK